MNPDYIGFPSMKATPASANTLGELIALLQKAEVKYGSDLKVRWVRESYQVSDENEYCFFDDVVVSYADSLLRPNGRSDSRHLVFVCE
jgi:hypothetical protein